MKVIIPAKAHSERVPGKNWRPFHGTDSLVDITIMKLLNAGVSSSDIYLSCDEWATARETTNRHGVHFIQRQDGLTHNSVPLTDWVRQICGQVTTADDIAWAHVTDPLFGEYAECMSVWSRIDGEHYDSLVVSYPWRGYLMTETHQPVGWSFGEHHTPSQHLPQWSVMPFTFSIFTQASIARTGYHVGSTPYWYQSERPHVDIDTEFDFRVAQAMWVRGARAVSD